ncbi:MAG: MFS transporter [Rhodospirillaceae bacterium]|jgi:MFS transporter, OFA family, oxalate/formate antiporter|nr:MFS transporter [Rhodospirillaceae bacterium]MBT5241077.1 MFS transporter [Rhodospirillaceae bacterium]MBT5566733.1 MFS transporter [Rhodospirillaceae bacterium]MBT6090795.1 MFS transporter [Rhodospirillaceae bacterium]MBT7449505.1 MFS transporter [Rhodospirillaceae bacterium]
MNVFGFRIFYGWFVLGGVFTMYAVSNGISNFTLPLFYPYLMDEFGWNQAEVTRPAAIKFAFASIYNLTIGYLMDRYAPRPIMAMGGLVMVTGLISYIFMTELWHFTVIYLFFAMGLSMCGLIPCMVTTGRWFTKFRGRAVGILLMASSFGGAVIPLIIKGSLVEGDWREAMSTLAVLGFMFMVLPVLWPVKARPSDIGETPDGLTGDEAAAAENEQLGIVGNISVPEAARMPVFYLLLAATGILWFCITGVIQHQAIYLGQDQGVSGGDMATVFSLFFFCSVFGKFIFGYFSDRFAKGHIMLLAIINLTIGLAILRFVDGLGIEMIYLYAVVYGIGFSGTFTMIQLMVAELFMGSTYGRILGIYVFVDTLAASLGIFVLGQIRVAAGSYVPGIDLMIALALVATVCVLAVNRIAAQRVTAAA